MKKYTFASIFFIVFVITSSTTATPAAAISISNITVTTTGSIPQFNKYEVKFDVVTSSQYPFFQYDATPPPGITPGSGINVEAVITTPSGKTLHQPAFYMTDVTHTGSGSSMVFTETNQKHWAMRFSPQEIGTYNISLSAQDSSGTTSASVGTFLATSPVKDGFIRVSQQDSRYFEFSNGKLYWPTGPAWGINYDQYKNTGQNLERPWLAGLGIYSTNWARWKSSAEQFGNEGIQTRLSWREKFPGHDLSYELFYPEGYSFWLTPWTDDMFGARLVSGRNYQVKFTYKTVGISGPRITGFPYGLTVKTSTYGPWGDPPMDTVENALRDSSTTKIIINHITTNQNWTTVTANFVPNANYEHLYVYLDNVTAGQAYIDEFSMIDTVTGGEVIRNPRADQHTYAEQRPAAYVDWQIEQGETNGVFFKYVVHDKNDWIPNHLLQNGQWADTGNGYNQSENSKASWLLRQWYRYLLSRWGYSTAVHSWEMVNEADPNDSVHWAAAQRFAKFMHDNDTHPHLATTSFWCCWQDELPLWKNTSTYPDIGYADIHEYSNNPQVADSNYTYDVAAWIQSMATTVYDSQIGKPTVLGELGLAGTNWSPLAELKTANPGIWYHNMLWVGLGKGALFSPNYWFSEHFKVINRIQIGGPFYQFVRDLDVNQGGYVDAQALPVDSRIRAWGQKNLAKNKALLWIQNSDHTWKKVMDQFGQNDGDVSQITSDINLTMSPSTTYSLEWWNTYTGTKTIASATSDASGNLRLTVTNLGKDIAVKITGTALLATPTPTPTPTLGPSTSPPPAIGNGDVNGDGQVTISDARLVIGGFSNPVTTSLDQYGDSKINSFDFAVVVLKIPTPVPTPSATPLAVTPTPTASPTIAPSTTPSTSPVAASDWTQEAHDAQRTGYTDEEPAGNWSLAWTWNGPDNSGGTGNHTYDAPEEARTVTGGNFVYVPAGSLGLYALNKSNGGQAWHNTSAIFNGTPAYDPATNTLLSGATDGKLYKINASTGAVLSTYSAGGTINRSVLINGFDAYVITDTGVLHKVAISNMSGVWIYTAGSGADTALAYSSSRNTVIFGTKDLYVHAVNANDGTGKWRVKPSPLTSGFPNEFHWYWPAVSDRHGIVFIRQRIDHDAGIWGYPSTGGAWPNTNTEARNFLTTNPDKQTLFALNLDDGSKKFIPPVGAGGVDDWSGGRLNMTTGPLPALKTLPDGTQVAYIPFRNGQSRPSDGSAFDGRWDSHMGEMVLENTGSQTAGDLRFVKMSRLGGYGGNSYVFITDEQTPITVAGNTIFNSHWGAMEAVRITNRSASLGLSYGNPIQTTNLPVLIRRQSACADKNTTTHWTTCGLSLYNDGRYWDGPGWWTYWNVDDPPGQHTGGYGDGMKPRYSYVSSGLVITEGNGGELVVFQHN